MKHKPICAVNDPCGGICTCGASIYNGIMGIILHKFEEKDLLKIKERIEEEIIRRNKCR